ncbi:MAG: MtnX-like HAD-IB family phosphatase [Candidatus Auribacterota bacterium]|jgi:2,3-diketo-5-methylthio-1-phosphopentane phosphatase|nr:MtnX-like HAD-IB family phosphatase [Candidatus Auribacterota bacterium]
MSQEKQNFLSSGSKPIIYCDFDGTITLKDTLVHILDTFASPHWHDIELRVKSGEIGCATSLVEEFATFHGSWEEVRRSLLNHIDIDPEFLPFMSFCRDNDIEFIVLSGGFSCFIDLIFTKEGVDGVRYFSNEIFFKDNKAELNYPYFNHECGSCGHCKTSHVKLSKKGKSFPVIYIGDGTTDRCPVKQADLVFAKDSLARYCSANGIPFIPWENFADIKRYLARHFAAS